MPIVGTAGHVDHGKSTLVRALTGTDPDRWAEEQRRGLTIDLGFAWADLGTGVEVGFVDVPGHERFIKNMLAGVGGIDVALFVVAADEGWMPQSEEHLAVLDVLGIGHGVVALTRRDLVDEARVETATAEVAARLKGTSLEGAPIVPVAAPTAAGIDLLRRRLEEALLAAGGPVDLGRPRLWVDRSFAVAGAGTVVTGTLTGGRIAVGDELMVYPTERPVRVRGLHHHGRSIEAAEPASRTAINLSGLEREAVPRGAMLGRADDWRTTRRFLADLSPVRSLGTPLTARGAFRIHVGSGSWPVRLQLVEGPELTGTAAAVVSVGDGVPLTMGDRFVLREVGRRAVVAGGTVLDPAPPHRIDRVRDTLQVVRSAADADPTARADALLEVRGAADRIHLRTDAAGGVPSTAVISGRIALSRAEAGRLIGDIEGKVAAYHLANPARAGIPKASLASSVGIEQGLLQTLLGSAPGVEDDGAVVRSSGFSAGWSEAQEASWQGAHRHLTEAGLAVPRASDLDLDKEVLHSLIRSGRLVRIAPDLVYLPEQIDAIRGALGDMDDGFTVAEFRDALDVTRRHAVPLLEWFDRNGETRRRGDGRTVRPPRSPGPPPGDAPPQ